MNIWETRSAKARQENDRAVLIDAAGQIQMDTVRRLLLLRDNRDIGLLE